MKLLVFGDRLVLYQYRIAVIPLSTYSSAVKQHVCRKYPTSDQTDRLCLADEHVTPPINSKRADTILRALNWFAVRSAAYPRMRARRSGLHSFDDAIHDGQVHVSTNTDLPVTGIWFA